MLDSLLSGRILRVQQLLEATVYHPKRPIIIPYVLDYHPKRPIIIPNVRLSLHSSDYHPKTSDYHPKRPIYHPKTSDYHSKRSIIIPKCSIILTKRPDDGKHVSFA